MRFNTPPGWPAAPADWAPPPDWRPDPTWPAAPPGWVFWTADDGTPLSPPGSLEPPAATEGPPPDAPGSWFARHKVLTWVLAGLLVIAVLIGVSQCGGGDDEPSGDATTTAAEDPAPDEEQPEETVEAEEPGPEPEPEATTPPPDVHSGSGDTVLTIAKPDGADSAAIVRATHDGAANFVVTALDADMEMSDLLVNVIGPYSGNVLLDELGTETSTLQIQADGSWTVEIHSLLDARPFEASAATGTGDDVLTWDGGAGTATLSHDGDANFIVSTYPEGGFPDLLVNEIGPYEGTVPWRAGPILVEVLANGGWSITVQ